MPVEVLPLCIHGEDVDLAIRLEPDGAGAYLKRGIVKQLQGDLRGGALDGEQSLRLNPRQSGAKAVRQRILELLGRPSRY